MNAHAWYSSHGAAANTATKKASLIGAKNAPAGFSAIICCPAGSRETSGSASHVYSWLVNGSSASRAATTPTMPRSSRERSSNRCSNRLPAPVSSGALIGRSAGDVAGHVAGHVVGLGLVAGRVATVGRRHRGRGFGFIGGLRAHGFRRAAHGVEFAPRLRIGLAYRGVDVAHRVLGLAQAALELVGGQFALQLAAHRRPRRA